MFLSHSVAIVIISRSYLTEGSPFKGFKQYLAIKTASHPSVEVNKLLCGGNLEHKVIENFARIGTENLWHSQKDFLALSPASQP